MSIGTNFSDLNYEQLIVLAKKIDPNNYMDLVHDQILTGKSFKELKFNYKSCAENDFTQDFGTANTCIKCNEVKPIACFRVISKMGRKYVTNVCKDCNMRYFRERYNNNSEFKSKVKKSWKKHYDSNREYYVNRSRKYRTENSEKSKECVRISFRKWYERNKDTPEFKEARRVYQRRYREKKKINN